MKYFKTGQPQLEGEGNFYRPPLGEHIDFNSFYDDMKQLATELRELRSCTAHDAARCLAKETILDLISAIRPLRQKFLGSGLFADPAWDMLIELKRAEINQLRVSVTILCAASGVPSTTALRWISILVSDGMLIRNDDPMDGRRKFVSLHPDTSAAMNHFLDAAIQQMHARRIGPH